MNNHFPRILTLLRKGRGLSQKEVAASLEISQALLSHYEKGIRECGLDFVVKVAEYYKVSCDYLLGLSPHQNGATIKVSDLPDDEKSNSRKKGKDIDDNPDRKLLASSLSLLYQILKSCDCEPLTSSVTAYLETAIYRTFRLLYSSNSKNPQAMFTVSQNQAIGKSEASMVLALNAAQCLALGETIQDKKGLPKDHLPQLTPEKLSAAYPNLAPALFSLLQKVENHFS